MSTITRLTAIAAAVAISLAAATPAIACGSYVRVQPERATGEVVDFANEQGERAVKLAFGRPSTILVQYPHFANGSILYQQSFVVRTDDRVWALADALAEQVAKNRGASASVVLERAGRNQWRLVSFTIRR